MTNSEEETKVTHTPGSQPSTRPGSDEAQTITAPTPPVAQAGGAPEQDELADGTAKPKDDQHDSSDR